VLNLGSRTGDDAGQSKVHAISKETNQNIHGGLQDMTLQRMNAVGDPAIMGRGFLLDRQKQSSISRHVHRKIFHMLHGSRMLDDLAVIPTHAVLSPGS
jgi:hypothetical protein